MLYPNTISAGNCVFYCVTNLFWFNNDDGLRYEPVLINLTFLFQSSEQDVLNCVIRWGEHQLAKRIEERGNVNCLL